MRIAQIAPLFESVPPQRYGGTERVVHYLTEELVRRGHEVTLYASGDSCTSAQLVPCVSKALRLGAGYTDATMHEITALERVFRDASRYDVLHFHTGHLHFPTSRRIGVPTVTTQHGRLDIPELVELLAVFDAPLVSISDHQRLPAQHANWQATIYHGLPPDLYRPTGESGEYLAFLGRVSPEKRVDRAIEIAEGADMPLKIAAKVDKVDRAYFEAEIKSLLDHPLVEFVGDIDDSEKQELLGRAAALLFPIDWPEPFGLAMIEAMACGTPVIAWSNGSVPEIIRRGESGFIVGSIEEAVEAVGRLGEIGRAGCRAAFEHRFLASRMAEEYERVYQRLIMDCRAMNAPMAQRSLASA